MFYLGLLPWHQQTIPPPQLIHSSSQLTLTPVTTPLDPASQPLPPLFKTSLKLAQAPTIVPPRPLNPRRPDLPSLPEILPRPSSPPLSEPTPTSPSETTPLPEITVQIRQIKVEGSTVFSEQELQQVTDPFIGRQATFEDLLAIRAAITDLYTSNGYTTSGAFLPHQDVTNGVITVQVVEGELENIEIQGLHRLRPSYIRDRIQVADGPPVNIHKLEQALQLLQLDPLLRSVQAELIPGTAPGRSVLQLTLREAPPLSAAASLDNYNSPSTGSFGGEVNLGFTNILGLGDQFEGGYGLTEGLNTYNLSYSVPFNAYDGSLSLSYENDDSRIVEEPFDKLDITSDSETYSIGVRQPIIRTPTTEFALGFSIDFRRSQTYLFNNEPFSFSEGPEDGEARETVLRLTQDWVSRSSRQVFAARSQFSIGIDALDATINDTGTDGRFISWVGQFQWVQALNQNPNPIISVVRIGTQLTPDSLLPMEQFGIGGIDTVRGYRENQLVADNGVLGSIEVRFPVVQDPDGIGNIQIVPFIDVGTVWDNRATLPAPTTLVGTGLGLRWQLGSTVEARLDYGIPLVEIDQAGDSLQDQGLLFSVVVSPF